MSCLTTKEWIKKSKIIHKSKYDYSKSIYISSDKKIIIICPIHGEFKQRAGNHLYLGRGCLKCNGGALISKRDWVIKCQKKHGKFYNYSKSNFKGVKKKILIICPIHGEFWQTAEKHFDYGCQACAGNKLISKKEFISRSNLIHNFKYDYSLIKKLSGLSKKVKIICKIHGVFEQTANNHLQKRGCKYCANGNSSKKEQLWLDYHKVPNDKFHRNVILKINNKKFCVDGIFQKEKIIYEFLGDYWHGHPVKFKPDDINKINKKKFSELFDTTIKRIRLFREHGFKVISIWERTFDRKKIKWEKH